MEQKRVLWIVGAVGIFLLIVIGTALILYSPVQKAQKMPPLTSESNIWVGMPIASQTPPAGTPVANENPAQSSAIDLNTELPKTFQNLTVHSQNTQVYTNNATVDAGQSDEHTIQLVNRPDTSASTTGTTSTQGTGTAKAAQPATGKTETATASTTKKTDTKATGPSSGTASKSTGSSTVKTVTKKTEDKFFVQVGSFTSKKNAEDTRALLTAERIPAEIFTWKNDSEVVYYRLRVGPYKTKNEAEYWNTRIQLIDGFNAGSSYVVMSPAEID